MLGSEVGDQHYATLSYSWGRNQTITLGKDTYDTFRSSIDQTTLPKTIQEAIYIARGLDIRYLWVDALCVIQGDEEDFAQEISCMGSFYAGSLDTIAAADGL